MKFLLDEITAPLLRRVGTTVAAFLVGHGVATETSHMIATGAVALLGVGLDLTMSAIDRRKAA